MKSAPLKIALNYTIVAVLVMLILFTAYDLRFQPASAVSVSSNVNANIVLNGTTGQPLTTIYSTSLSTSRALILWGPQHLYFIYVYHGPAGIVISEPYAPFKYAWNWILPFDPVPQNGTFEQPDPFSAPTYFRVDVAVTVNGVATHYTPIWYHAQANLALWYGFLPALVGLGYAVFKWKPNEETVTSGEKPKERRRTDSEVARDTRATALFILSGMVLNYVPWLVLSILVKRIGFNYYMIYVLPFVAMGLAFTWKLLPKGLGKSVLALNVLLALAFFIYYFPVHPMP